MRIKKIIIVVSSTVASLVALAALTISILSYAKISIPLESVRQQFVEKATELTGHKVRIDGEVRLAISLYPTLVVDQLHIANEPGWSADDILSVSETRVQLALLPIFEGRLEFIEISASSIEVNLEQARDGRQNWKSFISKEKGSAKKNSAPDINRKNEKEFWVEEFKLTDFKLNYTDEHLGRSFSNHIDSLVVNTENKTHLTASIRGTSKENPYSFTATSDLLRNLLSNEPWQMKMQGMIADKPLNFEIHLDQTNPALSGSVKFDASKINIGQTLSWLGLAEGLEAYSEKLAFTTDIKGRNLQEILERSDFTVQLSDGYWILHDPADNDKINITFSSANFVSKSNKPVLLEIDGEIDDSPIQLQILSEPLSKYFTKLEKVHLDLSATFTHSKVKLKGDIDLPISRHSLVLDLKINGQRMDKWNKLLNANLPPFGPYLLKGIFSINSNGFNLKNLEMQVRSSDLGGEITVDTRSSIAHWDFNLISQHFQVNDFDVEGFSLLPETNHELKARKASTNIQENKIDRLSHPYTNVTDKIPNFDANLELKAVKVQVGNDTLAGGHLLMSVSNKALTVKQLHLDLPGGEIDASLALERQGENLIGHLKLDMDKFNYGVVYRYLMPDSEATGEISTRINLQLNGKDFASSLNHASGQLDFAVWPENISADIIDIWSVNLFLAILPELNKEKSKLNCAVALLDENDGQLSEELLFIDTSKIWMKGNLHVDYPNETLSLSLFPTAKKAKLFGLQAPMRIKGTFSDIRVSIKPMDIVGAYFKFLTSPLHAPFRRMFANKAGEDMSELCGELLDREHLKKMMKEYNDKTPTLDEMYE